MEIGRVIPAHTLQNVFCGRPTSEQLRAEVQSLQLGVCRSPMSSESRHTCDFDHVIVQSSAEICFATSANGKMCIYLEPAKRSAAAKHINLTLEAFVNSVKIPCRILK